MPIAITLFFIYIDDLPKNCFIVSLLRRVKTECLIFCIKEFARSEVIFSQIQYSLARAFSQDEEFSGASRNQFAVLYNPQVLIQFFQTENIMTDLPVAIDLRYSHKPGTGRYGHQAFALADSDMIAIKLFFGYNP